MYFVRVILVVVVVLLLIFIVLGIRNIYRNNK